MKTPRLAVSRTAMALTCMAALSVCAINARADDIDDLIHTEMTAKKNSGDVGRRDQK